MLKDVKVQLSDFKIQMQSNNELNNYIKTQKEFILPNINLIGVPLLWNKGYTGQNVTIAIIDTGCVNHPDLINNIIGGKNFTNEGTADDYTDRNCHRHSCSRNNCI